MACIDASRAVVSSRMRAFVQRVPRPRHRCRECPGEKSAWIPRAVGVAQDDTRRRALARGKIVALRVFEDAWKDDSLRHDPAAHPRRQHSRFRQHAQSTRPSFNDAAENPTSGDSALRAFTTAARRASPTRRHRRFAAMMTRAGQHGPGTLVIDSKLRE